MGMRTSEKFCEDRYHVLFIAHCPENSVSLVQLSSVTQLCPTLCNPMDWSTPGFPVLHHLLSSNHLILCCPLLLLPLIFPSIRIFSNESVLHIWWPKYWSFNFSISPFSEYSGLIFFRTDGLITSQRKTDKSFKCFLSFLDLFYSSLRPALKGNTHLWEIE